MADERLLNMIESLINHGAEVRLGKRRMHVILKDEDGRTTIACGAAVWEAYKASGRRMPGHMQSGLR